MHDRSSDRPTRLVLFPGLAADGRAFEPQRLAFPWLEVPPWIMPLRNEQLQSYSQRMARQIVSDDRPLYLGGFSFGAIVALEVARHLPAAGVFLIGGGLSHQMITWPFRWMCHVAPLVPLPLVPLVLKFFPLALDVIEKLTDEQKWLYVRMSKDTPRAMIRWGAGAMMNWDFTGPLPAPVHAIHGHDDRIVRPDPRLHPRLVPGGRHLISMSHARVVNGWMGDIMFAQSASPTI